MNILGPTLGKYHHILDVCENYAGDNKNDEKKIDRNWKKVTILY